MYGSEINLIIAFRRGIRATKNRALQRAGDTNMRMNAKELIADARATAPTLPPAAAKLMTAMADRLDLQFVVLCESRNEVKQLAAENAALKSNLMFWDAEDPEVPYCSPEDIANEIMLGYNEEFDVQVAARLPNRKYRVCKLTESEREIELVDGGDIATPATDVFLDSLRAEAITDALEISSEYLDTDCVMDRHDISYQDAELRAAGAMEMHDSLVAVANHLRNKAG
jgi:hypothetical protein